MQGKWIAFFPGLLGSTTNIFSILETSLSWPASIQSTRLYKWQGYTPPSIVLNLGNGLTCLKKAFVYIGSSVKILCKLANDKKVETRILPSNLNAPS